MIYTIYTMADTGQFAKDADILLRLPTGCVAAVKAAGYFDKIVLDQEAIINCICRFDWDKADTASTLNTSVRGILIDTAASLCAIEGIIFDMTTDFASRIEAEDCINVLRDISLRNLSILRDKKVQDFMIGA